MKIQMLTIAYGAYHVELFRKCVRSLAFKKNRTAIYANHATWNIVTDPEYFEDITRYMDAYFPELKIALRSIEEFRDYCDPLQSVLLWQIKRCIESGQKLLLAPPDTFWGDGSISGILNIGQDEGTCVMVPHVRVNPSILKEEHLSPSVSNAELVALTWRKDEFGNFINLHRSWSEAEAGHEHQNTFASGVSWKQVDDDLYEIIHRLPTPYLMHFNPKDYDYFEASPGFGNIDHTWPGDILIEHDRQKYVGASDLAFMVEITENNKNIPPPDWVKKGTPDKFWREMTRDSMKIHNKFNKQISAIFRKTL